MHHRNKASRRRSDHVVSIKTKTNLAMVPIAFLRPQTEASRTDCALPTIGKVALNTAWRIARVASAGATVFSCFRERKTANCEGAAPSGTAYKLVRSRTSESGDTAQSSWSARCYAELKVLSSYTDRSTRYTL